MADEAMKEAIEKVLSYGLQAAYDAIETKDPLMLYFCTDTRKMFKGDQDFTESVRFVTAKPEAPARGVLYVIETATGTSIESYNGTVWKTILPAITDVISKDEADYAEDAPTKIPTMKAVKEFVTEATGGAVGTVVTEVKVGEGDASISVKVGSEEATELQLQGVATKPSYDPETRTFTFPVTGSEEALVVKLGKDIFLDGSKPNGYNKETKKLELYLNDETGTKLEIPVDDLLDIEEIAELTNRVSALEEAHGWGTF